MSRVENPTVDNVLEISPELAQSLRVKLFPELTIVAEIFQKIQVLEKTRVTLIQVGVHFSIAQTLLTVAEWHGPSGDAPKGESLCKHPAVSHS
jgi:hypothetical protein